MREFLVGEIPTLPWWRQWWGVQSRGAEGTVGGIWVYLVVDSCDRTVTPAMDDVTTGFGMKQMKVFLIGFLP